MEALLYTVYIHGYLNPRFLRQFRTEIPGNPPSVAIDVYSNRSRFPRNHRPEWSQRTQGKSLSHQAAQSYLETYLKPHDTVSKYLL